MKSLAHCWVRGRRRARCRAARRRRRSLERRAARSPLVDDAALDEQSPTVSARPADEVGRHVRQVRRRALVDELLALIGRQTLDVSDLTDLSGANHTSLLHRPTGGRRVRNSTSGTRRWFVDSAGRQRYLGVPVRLGRYAGRDSRTAGASWLQRLHHSCVRQFTTGPSSLTETSRTRSS